MNGATDEAMKAHFESAGLEHVRLLATAGFPNNQALALAWFAQKEREAREQQLAFQSAQAKVADSTLSASRTAAKAAIVAVWVMHHRNSSPRASTTGILSRALPRRETPLQGGSQVGGHSRLGSGRLHDKAKQGHALDHVLVLQRSVVWIVGHCSAVVRFEG